MLTAYKVLLVDDHELVRLGVKSACPEVRGIPVDWLEAATLEDAMQTFAAESGIDLVLLDLNLADSKGLQGLRLFLQRHSKARVAVFSATHDEFVVRQARALRAVGYLSKGSNPQQLHDALNAILTSPYGAEGRLPPIGTASFPRLPATAVYDRVAELGPRHLEILELVLSGCTNQEISTVTKLSLGTVKNYVSSLLLALDVRSRSHLISLFR